jgi:A/G-specific adenine glycosylase
MPIQKQKVRSFEETISDYFQKAGRDFLPWRKVGITAYEVWVSEIMLQQTQVSRVIGYYERFLKKFPTIEKLGQATWEEFLPYYDGLGYYARGRNMLLAAQKIVSEHKGIFPRDKEVLQTLPGVGPYTASAIMSFAYGDPHLAWDTNLKRVVGRFFLGSKKASVDEAWFERMFVTGRRELNASLMDFGSSICVSRPKCNTCPLSTHCVYFKEKGIQEKKEKNESQIFPLSEAERVTVILHEKHREYFSVNTKRYMPFTLPVGYVTREAIKAWFLDQYGLKLAVRPPHDRCISDGQKTLFVNAQILDGKHSFAVFSKEAIKGYNKGTHSPFKD